MAEKERGRRQSRKGPSDGGQGRRSSAFFLNEVTVHAARVSHAPALAS